MLLILLLSICLFGASMPAEPGKPGAEWTADEIEIVREKIIRMLECSNEAGGKGWSFGNKECWKNTELYDDMRPLDEFTKDIDKYGPKLYWNPTWHAYFEKWRSRRPTPGRLIQLAFHDCLRYKDNSGGCDGCLNWAGMGFVSEGMDFFDEKSMQYGATPTQYHTTNNKLQMTARSLELIYTKLDWPPESTVLPRSLKDSGKSRADLWQLAGNIGLERAINNTNESGRQLEYHNSETTLCAEIGKENCLMTLDRYIPFRTGRKDCIANHTLKWTDYGFEATKEEKHSNTYGTGIQAIKDMKRDFNLTAKESIALFALHGLSVMGRNPEEAAKYKWSGGSMSQDNMKTTFSNMYHKTLNGNSYSRGWLQLFGDFGFIGYHLGDANGHPVGKSGFYMDCHMYWNTRGQRAGGPCHFRPTTTNCNVPSENKDLELRVPCFEKGSDGTFLRKYGIAGCENADLFERDGFKIQIGGPAAPSTCDPGWQFVMPFEMSLVMDFDVDNITNLPTGCGPLDGNWKTSANGPGVPIYAGSIYQDNTPCKLVEYAPEELSLPKIVEMFAKDHESWQNSFFDGWEKIQLNGHSKETLTEAPRNGQLMAPFMG